MRDSEARASREGFPPYVREESKERDRSPVRGESHGSGEAGLQGVDMRVTPTSRPPSSLSQDLGQPHLVKSAGGELLTKKEERICDDISIIAEKEGTRSGANSVTGRASVNSDHSISRINGLEGSSPSVAPLGAPLLNSNGLKSDSPSVASVKSHHQPGYPGLYPGTSGRAGQAAVPPAVSSYLPPSHHPLAPPTYDFQNARK